MLLAQLTGPRASLWLLATIVILRAPGLLFGVLNIDESDLVVAARMMGEGALPYVDFVEKKPLLLYLFYAPAVLSGFEMWPMQILAILWCFATCRVVEATARAWTGRSEVGAVAAWLCALATNANVVSVNAELLMSLPAAAALLCFWRAAKERRARLYLFAGLCVALATLFKQQAGILLVAFVLFLVWRRRAACTPLAMLGAGFALPWMAAGAVYAALGHFSAFWEWNVTRNFAYGGYGVGSALARFALGLALYVALSAPLAWWLSLRASLQGEDDGRRLFALALWLSWVPVSLSGRFYAHYYLQFVPPLAILAAPRATELVTRWRGLGRAARAALLLALALPSLGYLSWGLARGALGGYPAQEPRTCEIARWIRAHTAGEARVFVWGHYTPIYYLARRLPGTRYYNTAVHVGDFDPAHLPPGFDVGPHRSEPDIAQTVEDLDARRPLLVVDTAPADIHHWSKVPLAKAPRLERYVLGRYEPVARPGGALVYRRRDVAHGVAAWLP
jgi:hypothetical protein